MSKPIKAAKLRSIAFDVVAVQIGDSYRRGIIAHAAAGKMLANKRATLGHSEWLPWLKAHREPLGFDVRAAQRLMEIARIPKATLTTPLGAKQVARIWGNGKGGRGCGRQSCEWYSPHKAMAVVRPFFSGKIDTDPASCQEANDKYV